MGKINVKGKTTKKDINEANVPAECEGYKIVRIKCSEDSKATHCVLAKEHSVREKNILKPENRTIFLRSVPPFVTKETIVTAFGIFGKVTNVFFHLTPSASILPSNTSTFFEDVRQTNGFKVAYVVFNKAESAQKAMLHPPDRPLILWPSSKPTSNVVDEWINEYNRVVMIDTQELKREVDNYMKTYDKAVEENKQVEKMKEEEQEADDGWITVSKKSGIPRKESVHHQIMQKQDNKLKKSQVVNFYRFQIKESKITELMKLREKFEEDKKRIAQLKESRKFKPF